MLRFVAVPSEALTTRLDLIHNFSLILYFILLSFLFFWPPLLATIAGLGYFAWKYMWFVHVNLPIGRLTSVRNVDPHRGNGTVTLLTFTPILNQNKNKNIYFPSIFTYTI